MVSQLRVAPPVPHKAETKDAIPQSRISRVLTSIRSIFPSCKIEIPQGHRLVAFLCHSSQDKPAVRQLYRRLLNDDIDPWLDEEKLLPGQDWQFEILKAVRTSDIVIVCLSRNSITKEGFVQKEIKHALDVAEEKPEGTLFLIPVKLEDCNIPERLRRWQWLNFFEEGGYEKLMLALRKRADALGLPR
jgi:hypothetical protein